MKRALRISIVVFSLAFICVAAHLHVLSNLNGNEKYPEDSFLNTVDNKTALIIVAHDDDAIGCAGTITELTKKGWAIHYLTFYGSWRKEDNPIRKKEAKEAGRIQNLASVQLVDFSIQRSDTVKEPWRPIPYSEFSTYMHVDSVKEIIAGTIAKYNPSVLFTLDNVIGGYGHPEHVCVSQAALDACLENKTSVERVYQAVFPRTLNENILKNNPAFIAAKKVYKAEGSPIPTVEMNIVSSSAEKKAVMDAYKSQKRNLTKIWPYYNYYPHWIYFRIFDKEYFHVIEVK